MKDMKTYIVLPFKDRLGKYQKAMDAFINPFIEYLDKNLGDYEIIIVEQKGGSLNDSLPQRYSSVLNESQLNEDFFNLGRTINIGFDILKDKMNDDDIFIFHPVDLLPVDVDYKINKTTKFCYNEHSPDGKFYKSIAFKCSDFKKINGFSNEYWGWGLEDDNLFIRLNRHNIEFDTKIDKYERLTNDGNGLTDDLHFMPLYGYNNMLNDMNTGLNNLSYKLLNEDMYNNIKKYIIE
jgi:hypothetical protein